MITKLPPVRMESIWIQVNGEPLQRTRPKKIMVDPDDESKAIIIDDGRFVHLENEKWIYRPEGFPELPDWEEWK